MSTRETFTGYLSFTSGSLFKSQTINCIFQTQGKVKQGWFDLFQIGSVLGFKYNFNVSVTRPDAVIHVLDRKSNNLFAELGLIQVLVYAHPALDEKTRTLATWQLYDNSPMVNGFIPSDSADEIVKCRYIGNSYQTIEFNPKSDKHISYLVY
jgi:hypothetical protein